jgi:PAS domain S-box-containing protein
MDTNLKPSGIEALGQMAWGTHFCLFYNTREDLLDILVPYFKVGLRGHEFCLYVASESVIAEEAARALREAVPDFEHYLSEGHIEIISHTDWYLKGGRFDPLEVGQGWLDKLEQALEKGYAGMRIAANISWLEQQDWDRFAEYEGKFDHDFHQLQIIALCAYDLNRYSASNVLDLIHHHQFTLARRDGAWEPLEGAELRRAHEKVLNLNNELEQRVAIRTAELAAVNEQLRKEIINHKRIEQAVRTHEYRLQATIDAADIGVSDWDLASKQITWLGHHEMLFGFAPGEFDGNYSSFEKRVHAEDLEKLKRVVQQARDEQSEYVHEYRVVWPDGSIHWIAGRGRFVYNEAGQPLRLYGAVLDITKRKKAEEALRESEELYRFLAENMSDVLTLYDLDRNRVYVSPSILRVLGWLSSETFGGIHPEDLQSAKEVWQRIVAGEKTVYTFRHAHADGSWRWLEAWGSLVHYRGQPHVIAVSRDITERKQAEQDIRRYAARMEALVEISHAFVEAGLEYQSVLNTVARRTAELIGDACVITLFSEDNQRAFPVAFHHSDPNALALMEEELLHIWQGGTVTESFQMLLSGESIYIPVVDPEEYRAQSEPEFWHYLDVVGVSSVLIVPLKAHGRVIGTLGVTRNRQGTAYTRDDQILLQDLAERASLTIQNAELFRQVQGAREQLGALSRRLLEVQDAERRALTTELHDRIGQNLTGLSINLQNMKALLPDETAKVLGKKFDDVQVLVEDTTRQIRDIMAELHLPELEDYGLAVALETYAERAASRGNLELIADLPDLAPPPLPSNVRIALFRAAQESISNVLKHANATQLEISLQGEDGRVRLRVEDDGQGFDPNAASQKEARSWGLKIMRERIESIGGKVQIKSKPGEGTRVIFDIKRPS